MSRIVPHFQEIFKSRSIEITLRAYLSLEIACASFTAVRGSDYSLPLSANEPCCLNTSADDEIISANVSLYAILPNSRSPVCGGSVMILISTS